jgi:formate-dependent nitrite reductase cytochrome c552 subunit
MTDFNFGNGQAEVEALMNELASKYGYASYTAMVAATTAGGWDNRGAGVTSWQREAAYPLYFLNADHSKGAHNPTYARSLLQNAIDYYDEHVVVMN